MDRAQWEGAGEAVLAFPASVTLPGHVEEMGPEWGPQACAASQQPLGLHTPSWWPGRWSWCGLCGVPGGPLVTPPSPRLCRYRVVVEGERGNRPHIYCLEQLLQEAVRVGVGRGGAGAGLLQEAVRAGLGAGPAWRSLLPSPDHRREAGLHALLAARDQDRGLLEPAVPLPVPRYRGPR